MKLFKITDYNRYAYILEAYQHKDSKNNDYLQSEAEALIAQGRLYEYCIGTNAFLFVEKDGFYRMYYHLNDLSQSLDFNNLELVTEILFRGDEGAIQNEIDFLERCGFKKNLIRDQYVGRYGDLRESSSLQDIIIEEALGMSEVEWACRLFNISFDKWSGDIINKDLFKNLLLNHCILVARTIHGNLLGALHQTIEKGVAWISHVAVTEQARGKGVGKALMEAFIERNHADEKSRYMLWVQRQNVPAVNMYQQKGFKYINKSTISLIKKD